MGTLLFIMKAPAQATGHGIAKDLHGQRMDRNCVCSVNHIPVRTVTQKVPLWRLMAYASLAWVSDPAWVPVVSFAPRTPGTQRAFVQNVQGSNAAEIGRELDRLSYAGRAPD